MKNAACSKKNTLKLTIRRLADQKLQTGIVAGGSNKGSSSQSSGWSLGGADGAY